MAVELVTGYKGKDHVTAEQLADFNRGIFGDAAILPVGNRMETVIQTANQITIKDGVVVLDGREIYIAYGESENIAIQSGTQGMNRNDIVVLEYTRNEDTGVEGVQFKVVTGNPLSGSAKDPAINNMDIRTGVSVSQKPFCRVRLNGTAIEGIDMMIDVVGAETSLQMMMVGSKPLNLEAGKAQNVTIEYKCPKTPKTVLAQADGGAPFECSVSVWTQTYATVGVKSTETLSNRKVRLVILY